MLANVTLDDKYTLECGRVFLTGTQALVRLLIEQRRRDRAAGLNTAGFVSGYRGSPLGNVDRELWRAQALIDQSLIRFQPGLNEDLAATAVWGTQQTNLFPGARYDGVFAMWYGKGPGVDRSGDVFRHANLAGTAPHGGVLLLAGDDPGARSSTVASQSEYALVDAQIPVLHPATIREFIAFGLLGWAMSRYSGCWVAMKVVSETVDSSASIDIDPGLVAISEPADFEMPPGGVHIRLHDWPPYNQEFRLQRHKLYAALAFARANHLDRVVIDAPNRRFGIVTTGKSYMDVRQALDDLGIDDALAADIGLSIYKVGLSWPLEREGIRRFAEGLEEILVVEDKRAVIENQLKEQLYNWQAAHRPRVVGKFDERDEWILPSAGELSPARIARVIAGRIQRFHSSSRLNARLAFLDQKDKALAASPTLMTRVPYYCSGCPHNTSTRVPEGSRAVAGIGCHFMVTWMDRATDTFTHMGGEGANWNGMAPFTDIPHMFVNIGDGTYVHSGILAIRAAVAAGTNVTFKILYNDAVAMTGGQPLDVPFDVAAITRQVAAEGVKRIAVVADDPARYTPGDAFAAGVTVHHRDQLDTVQREFGTVAGPSVLVFDQTCAAEKRRRRKRGLLEDPPRRAFINQAVCEGCGDCGVQSNCVSIVPVETEFGRKRAIDQSSCNKDFSCLRGFCPSFVTVHGGTLRKRAPEIDDDVLPPLPEPAMPPLDVPYGIVVAGIGGTGVVTIGALLGMAAHLEGKGVSVLDQIGLAQKNGAVVTFVRIASRPEHIHAVRVSAGGAGLLLGCDLVTAAGAEILAKLSPGRSRSVVNTHATMTADFTRNPDLAFPEHAMRSAIERAGGTDATDFLDSTALSTVLLGDAIGSNMLLLGFACQKGLLPVSAAAIERAIELNGVAVDPNKAAFLWGRHVANDPAAIDRVADLDPGHRPPPVTDVDDIIAVRVGELTASRNRRCARRYAALVERVRRIEADRTGGREDLTKEVARSYFKLLAYKDEYEVARLFANGRFEQDLRDSFSGDIRLTFHLAPPLVGKRDPATGILQKREYGARTMILFRLIARLRFLRGTPLDPFAYTGERRRERRLIGEYEAVVEDLLTGLRPETHSLACEIAGLPQTIRGFGHVKAASIAKAKGCEAQLLAAYRDPRPAADAAE